MKIGCVGAFYHSVSLPQDCAAEVKSLLIQWLEAKGFRLVANRPLTQTDRQTQRGAFICWNKRWTVVLYSQFGEFERLAYELARLKRPILYVWEHDSDLWGYQIDRDRKTIASFNSRPAYFGRVEETGLATNGDPELLCQTFGLQGLEREIRKLQRAKSLLMEQVCEQFAKTIGARPAAWSYDYAEQSYLESGSVEFEEFETEHLFFANDQEQREMEGFDIHTRAVREFARSERVGESAGMPPEMRERVEQLQQQVRVMSFFFRAMLWPMKILAWPFVKLMQFWLWFTFKRSGKQREMTEWFITEGKPAFRIEGRQLINDRRRCRITLPQDVEYAQAWGLTVFAFEVSNVEVSCRAARRKEIEHYLTIRSPDRGTRTTLLEDENFMAGALKAKSVLYKKESDKVKENKPKTEYLGACMVQTTDVVYIFQYSSNEPISEAARKRIREAVTSFELF